MEDGFKQKEERMCYEEKKLEEEARSRIQA